MAKIVILDDTHEGRRLAKECLSHELHDVRTTADAEEAIDLAYLFEPDLLIADWDLQGDYDGLEVAAAFQTANVSIKTIVMSKNESTQKKFDRTEIDSEASELGLVGALAKPFSANSLILAVNNALASEQ